MNNPKNKIALPDWKSAKFPPKKAMLGNHCSLLPLEPKEHSKELYANFVKNNKNWEYLPYGPFTNYTNFLVWLETFCTKEDPQFWTIFDKEQQACGLASYLRIEPQSGVIEVGHIHFSPLLQKSIAASEAMYLMMKRVFDELGYRRYEWKTNSLNYPSRQAALRLGFSFEGIFRQHMVVKGYNRDSAWYSLLDLEWILCRTSLYKMVI